MTTGALVTRSIHPTSRVALLGATVVFAAGLAVGAGGMRVASGSATAHAAMPASVRTFAVTPTLDTSKPYLTVQHGIVVPPQSGITPTLDTSKPYLTVQHGIVVPPQR